MAIPRSCRYLPIDCTHDHAATPQESQFDSWSVFSCRRQIDRFRRQSPGPHWRRSTRKPSNHQEMGSLSIGCDSVRFWIGRAQRAVELVLWSTNDYNEMLRLGPKGCG